MILPKQEKLRVEVSSEYCQESFCFKFVPKSCNKVYKTILALIKTYIILLETRFIIRKSYFENSVQHQDFEYFFL